MYAGRTRNGFTPSARDRLFKRFEALAPEKCPFANLPEARGGRWGEGLTAEKMKDCRWLKPVLVGQFEFVEWTPDGHLRHARFMGLRGDRRAAGRGARGRGRIALLAGISAQIPGLDRSLPIKNTTLPRFVESAGC
jgi:ATP-dependent DNA ligase